MANRRIEPAIGKIFAPPLRIIATRLLDRVQTALLNARYDGVYDVFGPFDKPPMDDETMLVVHREDEIGKVAATSYRPFEIHVNGMESRGWIYAGDWERVKKFAAEKLGLELHRE